MLQIASFHPAYQFADTTVHDVSNHTNRSPYPMLHILREASVNTAVAAFPEAKESIRRTSNDAPPRVSWMGGTGGRFAGGPQFRPAGPSPKMCRTPADPSDGRHSSGVPIAANWEPVVAVPA